MTFDYCSALGVVRKKDQRTWTNEEVSLGRLGKTTGADNADVKYMSQWKADLE